MITRLTGCKARMVALAIAVAAIQPISALAQGQAAGPQVPREGGTPLPAAPSALATGQSIVMGGVPFGQATSAVLPLSLGEAIARGLKQNLGVVLGEQAVRSAAGVRWQSLSGLLPTAGFRVSQTREEINLEEFGFPVAPGQSPIIGPFNVAALHLSATAPVFDYAAIQRARAGAQVAGAAAHSFQDARDLVAYVTASLYLQAVAGASRIDAARTQIADGADALRPRRRPEQGRHRARHRGPARAGAVAVAAAAPDLLRRTSSPSRSWRSQRAVGIPLGQADRADRPAAVLGPATG